MAILDPATARKRLDDAIMAEPDLSSPKTGKLGLVKRLFAEITGLDEDDVAALFVSKPTNMENRVGQPGASGKKLAVAVTKALERKPGQSDAEYQVKSAKFTDGYVKHAREAVGDRLVQAVVVCELRDGKWNAVAVVEPQPSQLSSSVRACFPAAQIQKAVVELEQDSQGSIPPTPDEEGDLAESLFVNQQWVDDVLWMLKDKRALVLYGPPGTGKTFIAQKLAAHLQPEQSNRAVVQLHPSYGYEDFFEGYRPLVVNGTATLVLKDGPLRDLARVAAANPKQPVVLILDEMNRGNLPRIFGELFFLLEYRDQSARLMYSPSERFQLPKNMFFIGTMNTADRSIALLDQALRRRFHFAGLFPDAPPVAGMLRGFLHEHRPEMLWVADVLDQANQLIGDRNAAIGPSHFMRKDLSDEVLRHVWRASVLPSIEEHFFGQPLRVRDFELEQLKARLSQRAADAGTPTPGT